MPQQLQFNQFVHTGIWSEIVIEQFDLKAWHCQVIAKHNIHAALLWLWRQRVCWIPYTVLSTQSTDYTDPRIDKCTESIQTHWLMSAATICYCWLPVKQWGDTHTHRSTRGFLLFVSSKYLAWISFHTPAASQSLEGYVFERSVDNTYSYATPKDELSVISNIMLFCLAAVLAPALGANTGIGCIQMRIPHPQRWLWPLAA